MNSKQNSYRRLPLEDWRGRPFEPLNESSYRYLIITLGDSELWFCEQDYLPAVRGSRWILNELRERPGLGFRWFLVHVDWPESVSVVD